MTGLFHLILLRVTLAGIVSAAALRLAGEGAQREIVRLAAGLLMLLALLQPIAEFRRAGGDGLRLPQDVSDVSIGEMEEQNMRTVMSTVAASIAESLEKRAKKEGLDCDMIVVMENDENGILQIGHVTVYYHASDAARLDELRALVTQECGVSEERQELIER